MSTKIKVKGIGQLKVQPDTIFLNIHLISEENESKKAFEKQKQIKSQLINNLKTLKINEQDLKTSNLNMNPIYKTIQNKDTYEQILNGYRVTEDITLTLPMDIDFLNEVLIAINDIKEQLQFSVCFENTENHHKELLSHAYYNALETATILSEISNLEITEIDEIIENNNTPILREAMYTNALSITPRDVIKELEIEVIFKAKEKS